MIESMPRSRPVIIATYRMLEHYAITFWKNTWSNSTQNGMRKSDNTTIGQKYYEECQIIVSATYKK